MIFTVRPRFRAPAVSRPMADEPIEQAFTPQLGYPRDSATSGRVVHVPGFETPGEILGRLAAEHMARKEAASPVKARRWARPIMLGLTVVILLVAGAVLWLAYSKAASAGRVGADLTLYLDATRSWLSGHGFYHPEQLAGPYQLVDGNILYPVTSVGLFMPFLVLPGVLFWLIPIGIIGAVVWHHRPAPWAWPLMALCLAYPPTMVKMVHGNPFLWIAAFVALGTIWRGWFALVLLKPSLGPFALLGVRSRAWWWTVAALGLTIPLTLDYLTVLMNVRGSSVLYSLDDVPMLLVPLIAWARSWTVRRSG